MTTAQTNIAGLDVRVQRRSNARSIRVRVKGDGSVHVSAPLHATRREIERAVNASADWIREQRSSLEGTLREKADTASSEEQRMWRALVEGGTRALLDIWEPVLGVRHRALAFRNMTSRWGSCQPATGRICINTRLALYPPECLEYVVVHELCHFLVPDHGPRFKALLDQHLPEWRESQCKLNGR